MTQRAPRSEPPRWPRAPCLAPAAPSAPKGPRMLKAVRSEKGGMALATLAGHVLDGRFPVCTPDAAADRYVTILGSPLEGGGLLVWSDGTALAVGKNRRMYPAPLALCPSIRGLWEWGKGYFRSNNPTSDLALRARLLQEAAAWSRKADPAFGWGKRLALPLHASFRPEGQDALSLLKALAEAAFPQNTPACALRFGVLNPNGAWLTRPRVTSDADTPQMHAFLRAADALLLAAHKAGELPANALCGWQWSKSNAGGTRARLYNVEFSTAGAPPPSAHKRVQARAALARITPGIAAPA